MGTTVSEKDIKLLESVQRRATNRRVSFNRCIEICGKVLVARSGAALCWTQQQMHHRPNSDNKPRCVASKNAQKILDGESWREQKE